MLKTARYAILFLTCFMIQPALMALTGTPPANEFSLSQLKKASPPVEKTVIRTSESLRGERIEQGLLFTYAGRGAKKAFIAGNFSSWSNLPMKRGKNGVWYYFLPEFTRSDKIEYKFNIDGIWIDDPLNTERIDDGNGSFISVAQPVVKSESKQLTYRFLKDGSVEFRNYNASARFISIAGDFNNWNPENDIMARGSDDIWRLKKRLAKGTFRYKLIIDGEWMPDTYNSESASDGSGGICSVIRIK